MKILILCTGNSCRSQMAHGFLQSFDSSLLVNSAGTEPAKHVNPMAIMVMKEAGIDISDHIPQNVDKFTNTEWDYVITVCNNANESCPVFNGQVKHKLHIGFEDPSEFKGSEEKRFNEFRRIRDLIHSRFLEFYNEEIR